MICPNCGRENENGVKFCAGCGASLSVAQPQYQQPQYQQPQYQQPQYQQPQYQQPMYQQPMKPVVPGKGLGIASMVLGILSLVLFCIWYIAIPCGIIGAVLGGVALSKAKAVNMKNGLAVAGLVCSCIALGIAIIFVLLVIAGLAELGFYL